MNRSPLYTLAYSVIGEGSKVITAAFNDYQALLSTLVGLVNGLSWKGSDGSRFTAPGLTEAEAIQWSAVLAVLDQETNDVINDWKKDRQRVIHGGDSDGEQPARSVRPKGAGPNTDDAGVSEKDRFERDPLETVTAIRCHEWEEDLDRVED
jgi:hypothetical protein